jgi:hypothetical protein
VACSSTSSQLNLSYKTEGKYDQTTEKVYIGASVTSTLFNIGSLTSSGKSLLVLSIAEFKSL